jgi:6-phosphogluconate dehydrogenase, C-terminal domain
MSRDALRCGVRVQVARYGKWKSIVQLAVDSGVSCAGMASSLNYFETYRRLRMPHNLVQARPGPLLVLLRTLQAMCQGCPAAQHCNKACLCTKARTWFAYTHVFAMHRSLSAAIPARSMVITHVYVAFAQAQRDFFGSHTYERTDKEGSFHTVWDPNFGSKDSITTSGYNN